MSRRTLKLVVVGLVVLAAAPATRGHREPTMPSPVVDLTAARRTDNDAEHALDVWYYTAAQPTTTTTAPVQREGNLGAQYKQVEGRVVYGSGACGDDLPSCSILECESGGNLVAENPRSTASGKWQFLDSTWAGYGGYARAMYAPEDVQDAKARQVWAGGRGRGQWVCS